MSKMTKEIMDLFQKAPATVFATSSPDGKPNAVPIGAKKIIDDETILISDQFFGKTLENMKANPRVSVTFWEGHNGYQIKGRVTIETSGTRFEETARWIDEMSKRIGAPLKSKGAVILCVEEIYSVNPGPDAGKRIA